MPAAPSPVAPPRLDLRASACAPHPDRHAVAGAGIRVRDVPRASALSGGAAVKQLGFFAFGFLVAGLFAVSILV